VVSCGNAQNMADEERAILTLVWSRTRHARQVKQHCSEQASYARQEEPLQRLQSDKRRRQGSGGSVWSRVVTLKTWQMKSVPSSNWCGRVHGTHGRRCSAAQNKHHLKDKERPQGLGSDQKRRQGRGGSMWSRVVTLKTWQIKSEPSSPGDCHVHFSRLVMQSR
jgi:hypothetical protein